VDPSSNQDDDQTTLLRAGLDVTEVGDATFVLTVFEGPDQGRGVSLSGLEPSRALLGSSASCDLRLSDPEVSRRHASVESVGRRLRICDLGSKNGTFVDGVSIVEAHLQGGEVVRMGSTALRVDRQPGIAADNLTSETSFGNIIGMSTEMRRLYPVCAKLASSNVAVVIEGETGTGKEVLAESLHLQGPRASEPFVVFDCTAVPPNLVESELFGHERGAFTGAVSMRKGVFEQAHGGTLLIDEIGDLELSLQPKLLRVLERSEVRRIGGDRTIHVDVRVLSATRRDLDHEVQAGRFRDDLFHRLTVARIELPPLRRRRGDIPLLVRHFARTLGSDETQIPGSMIQRWQDYTWPGNVRELRNAVARYLALGDFARAPGEEPEPPPVARASDPLAMTSQDAPVFVNTFEEVLGLGLPLADARKRVVEQFEEAYVEGMLEAHGGVVTRAAAASGIARRHFYRLRAKGKR